MIVLNLDYNLSRRGIYLNGFTVSLTKYTFMSVCWTMVTGNQSSYYDIHCMITQHRPHTIRVKVL